jgi:predicted CopG family antitoxin
MSDDWTSLRIRRSTLKRLKQRKRDGESHDELVVRLLNKRETSETPDDVTA